MNTIQGSAAGTGPGLGDAISASFTFDTDEAKAPFTGSGAGGSTFSVYDVTLRNFHYSVGSYTVDEPTLSAYLNYSDNLFGEDFITFLFHRDGAGPYGSAFANGQLIAQGPGSILSSPSLSEGFPYPAFPTHRTVLGFGDGTNIRILFGDLTASVTAVPEPSNWALLILGFGCAGVAGRYRRSVQVKAA